MSLTLHTPHPPPSAGIDGPAAFLGSEAPDLGTKIQILSVSQSQPQPQQPQSPPAEEPDRDGDTETLLEPKTDIHELLQKRGELWGRGGGAGRELFRDSVWFLCDDCFLM